MARLYDQLVRIRQSDIDALTQASLSLAEAAATIERSKVAWAPAVMQLLRSANDAIIALRDRGLSRITAYLAKEEGRTDVVVNEKAGEPRQSPAPATIPEGWPGGKRE